MIAAIRIRGQVNVNRDIKGTMTMLHLTRTNHCFLLEETPSYLGMLHKVKDYVTFGNISGEALSELITKRGKLMGDDPITDEIVKEGTEFSTIQEFAEAIVKGDANYRDLPNVKLVFRLHPPIKGHKSVKRSFTAGGALGNRKEAIDDLIRRMI
jgi:large subunit ribosomal protein L30